jgi:cellulose synthase/poly-beta-1,6-N-acetylglucosamine synthase-like glycosyltransferase
VGRSIQIVRGEAHIVKTAIIIAAHNEARSIAKTLASIGTGVDVFVASDNSTDRTWTISKLFTNHVIQVERGGKGRSLRALIEHYDLLNIYDALIMLDADTIMAPGAIAAFEEALKPGVAGVTGNIQCQPGNFFARWRAIQYLNMRVFYRDGMAALNCIHVMCGTCSIWRTSALKQIPLRDNPVEDMLYTYEIHRRKLGKVAFARKAIVYTQEPAKLKDYTSQMLRWLRGYWGITAEFGTPFGRQSLDFGQAIIIGQFTLSMLCLTSLAFWPWLGSWRWVPIINIGIELVVITALAFVADFKDASFQRIAYLWLYPFMFVYDQLINLYAFATHRKLTSGVWVSPQRKDMTCTVAAVSASSGFSSSS